METNQKENEEVQSTSLIERAEKAAQKLEEANKKTEELLIKQEQFRARNILSGRAEAGVQEPSAEQKSKEKLNRIFAGTGLKV